MLSERGGNGYIGDRPIPPHAVSQLPLPFLNWAFIALTFFTLWAFYRATGKQPWLLLVLSGWLLVVGGISATGFFQNNSPVPPRVAHVILPMLVVGLLLGFTSLGKSLRAGTSLEHLHYFQGIRIVVEVVFLHGLYEAGYLARAVTYLGYNFDVVPGMLGPVVGYLVFRRKLLSVRWAVAYQYFGIAILTSTIVLAVLSAPSPYQQLGWDQPTVAIFYFPFIWLPALVAPLMLWAHFIALKSLGTGNRYHSADKQPDG